MIIKLEEAAASVKELINSVNEMRASLDIEQSEKKIDELEHNMQEDGFWDDMKKSQEVSKELKFLKDRIERYRSIKTRIDDVNVLIDMCREEENEEEAEYILNEVKDLKNEIEDFKIEILLSGEYDKNNAILNLHTGVGGNDAQDWTQILLRMYTRWAEAKGFKVEVIDMLPGDEAGIKSVTLKVTGEYAYGYLKAEKGIHRLVRISPFNANGKRQTSFASVEVLPELTENQDIVIRPEDLRIDTYRASGAGGQHINKTDSAIRITHLPTGVVVQCQNERSQHSNKETAMSMLKSKLVELKERAHKEKIEDLTGELKDMGWGSQIRSYVFQPYTMVKDHRTGVETGNVNAVMDGEIDDFIKGFLKQESNL
ncbi:MULTISPECIES: peptide chain release factor 2 [Clostridium]|uniref:peptide chain release factor 2 n=1 Tax=Clostridium TaxID=1485 RepID=UPI0018DD9182|nr:MULTISPECIES: peptide chain release factor 2 [Clostridium]MCD2347016.1 peptide chain release factor 2 [Clostridium guangxiense]